MDKTTAQNWLHAAPVGSRLCYHEGHLADDRRQITWNVGRFTEKIVEPVSTIGQLMWTAYQAGKVILFQERVAGGKFRYWASKRRK